MRDVLTPGQMLAVQARLQPDRSARATSSVR